MLISAGRQLRDARQAKGLSLEQAARTTHIRIHHLEALEAGRMDDLPSLAQARGYVRSYAGFLGLDGEQLLGHIETPLDATQSRSPTAAPAEAPVAKAGSIEGALLLVELGRQLRAQRELLGLSLETIAEHTHIRQHYLELIEKGSPAGLPSPVQGRGMIHNFATFLGLDPDPLLHQYAAALQAQLADRKGAPAAPRPAGRSAKRGLLSGDLLFGGAVILTLLLFVIWGVGRVAEVRAGRIDQATAPAIVDVLDPQPTPSNTPLAPTATSPAENSGNGSAQSTAPAPPAGTLAPLTNEDPVQVYLIAEQRAWLRVTVDGVIAFDGRVTPGSAYPFSGREQIEVVTSSGSAFRVIFNQNDLGPLGLFGDPVIRIFTIGGVFTPTPLASPTPTITPTPLFTGTPTPTATP